MAREATPVLALSAIVLGIVAAAVNADAWWFMIGLIAFLFLIERPS
ncbi:hypothetical protein ORV05_28915 [Amycolatopsis cynarae]|uniref:Phosphatidate cytidylyltransferase n=1 Tax=Amycolatopsis cynarae TaxID=2995223 RepID=A0ABY7B0Y6_9PSEU|nr:MULTISPECIES: hypothetical protein [Amycolatopsis]WAL64918.1 hypothetical protein ORV05_28915 [Amycolatopsis sp. HUAS 11-8]